MWTRHLFGTDLYHLISAFVIYSILGWFVESVYMSLCNRKITNRGFVAGPFCPIYGFGAVVGYMVLHPLAGNLLQLYICGSVIATFFELLTAKLMQKLFGEVWWDYNDKPFNYKGIICMESTLAWGLYAIIIVRFLNERVMGFVDFYSRKVGEDLIRLIFLVLFVDFALHLMKALNVDFREYREKAVDRYHNFRTRW